MQEKKFHPEDMWRILVYCHWSIGGLDTSGKMKTSEREWFSRGERGANTSRRYSDHSVKLNDPKPGPL